MTASHLRDRDFKRKCLAVLASFLCVSNSLALPTGGVIVAGDAQISTGGNALIIDQLSDRAIINWDDFSISANQLATFRMPGSESAVLNRVVSDNLSQIDGGLFANGHVYLINQNGIIVGKSGVIDTRGFVGSTLDLDNHDFLSSQDMLFKGAEAGAFLNLGTIRALDGDVFIIAPQVKNAGVVEAGSGSVGLAGGSEVLLRGSGHNRMTIRTSVDSGLVENLGVIQGAQVELQATGGNEYALAINNTGVVRADAVSQKEGRILLVSNRGTTENSGSLAAPGGDVLALGEWVAITGDASIDVSHASGGGSIRVGGDFQGANAAVKNANRTFIGSKARLRADALSEGDGGRVIVWADGDTRFQGDISALGAGEGQGGFVEVSGKEHLAFNGHVTAGQLLLDPKNIIIDDQHENPLTDGAHFSTKPETDVTISPDSITAITNAGTPITFQANNDITVNNSIVSNNPGGNGGDMTFQAGRSITLYANIDSDNGDVAFVTNDGGADGANRDAGAASFVNYSLIDAGEGAVSITMGDGGESSAINAGQVSGRNFEIHHNGPTAGAVAGQIDLGETTITDNLTITTSSARNLVNTVGTVTVRGTANVGLSGGDFTLDRATTNLNILAIEAGDVVVNDADAMRLGESAIAGDLTLTTKGPLASTGAVSVAGNTSLVATGNEFGYADPYINLSHPANDFQGVVTLSVDSKGATGTGGYAVIRDVDGIEFDAVSTVTSFTVEAGSAAQFGASDIGTTFSVTAGGAVDFGATNVGEDLAVSTTGAITDSGDIVVASQTTLSAGSGNDIALDSAGNNFNRIRVTSAKDVTLNDINAIEFGRATTGGSSSMTGDLDVTAGGTISQFGGDDWDYAAISVGGDATFTVTAASSDLRLGPSLSAYTSYSRTGAANSFGGSVTLNTSGAGSYRDIQLRNTSSNAGVVAGLGAGLRNVLFYFDNAPSVELPGMSLSGDLVVDALNGGITQSGAIVVDNSAGGFGNSTFRGGSNRDIDLSHAGNDFYRILIRDGRDVAINDLDGIDLYANNRTFLARRDLSVTAGGDIVDSSTSNDYNISVTGGTATFDSGAHDIRLDNWSNQFSTVAFASAGDVFLRNGRDLTLDDSNIAGTAYLQSSSSSYTLGQVENSTINTGGTTTFDAFRVVSLPSATNVLGAIALTNVPSNASITIRENDAITQANAWTSAPDVDLTTSDDQAIILDQNNNLDWVKITQINGDADTADVGEVIVRESSQIDQNAAWTTHGDTYIDSNGYDIVMTQAGNVLGRLKVEGNDVSLYENDTIEDYSAWTTTGVTDLRAYSGGVLGARDIVLDDASNNLGELVLTARNATVTEAAPITDYAGWNVSGTLTLDAGSSYIDLDRPDNQLGDIQVNGAPSWVRITDNSDITQAGAWTIGAASVYLDARSNDIVMTRSGNVLGNIFIQNGDGPPASVSITENDAITQGAAWDLSGKPVTLVAENGNSITLTNASNLMGDLTVTGGAVSITEDDDITDGGAWTTTGVTRLDPRDSASDIVLDNVGNVLGDLLIVGEPSQVRIVENDDITQSAAWNLYDIPVILSALDGYGIYLTQADNVLGDLRLTTALDGDLAGGHVSIVEADTISDGAAWSVAGLATLDAGANDIVVDADPRGSIAGVRVVSAGAANISADMDTLQIDSANSSNISDSDELVVAGANVATTLSIDADGALTQTGAIVADKLLVKGDGHATLLHAGNNVATLAAGHTGGDLQYSDTNDFQVNNVDGTTGIGIGAHDVSLVSVHGSVTGLTNVSADSSSLTISAGSGLALPSLSIAGSQTYTAGGSGIAVNGNLASTAAGDIVLHSAATLGDDVSLTTADGDIVFHETVYGAGNILTVKAEGSHVDFHGAVSGLGSSADASAALALTSAGARFHDTLAANNGITVTGPVTFYDDVSLSDGVAATVFGGKVTFAKPGDLAFSAYDTVTFNGGAELSGDASIDSNDSNLVFGGPVTGARSLTLDAGLGEISGFQHIGSDLVGLSVTANDIIVPVSGISIAGAQSYTATGGSSIRLDGDVTSTAAGAIVFDGDVELGAAVAVSSTDSSITFTETVEGAYGFTVDSGAGAIDFDNDVSVGSADGEMRIAGNVSFGRVGAATKIATGGDLVIEGVATLEDGDVGFDSNGNDIAFDGGIASSGQDVSVSTEGGALSFGAAIASDSDVSLDVASGSVSGLQHLANTVHDFTLGATSAVVLPSIETVGKQTYNTSDLELTGDLSGAGIEFNGAVSVGYDNATFHAGNGLLDFNGALTLGAHDATLIGADIDFAGAVSGSGVIALQQSDRDHNANVGGDSDLGFHLSNNDLGQLGDGFEWISIGRSDGLGATDIIGNADLGARAVFLRGGVRGVSQSGGSLRAGDVAFESAGVVSFLNSDNVLGDISISAASDWVAIYENDAITQGDAWTLGGVSVELYTGEHDIVLTEAANSFGYVSATGGDVSITENEAIVLHNMEVGSLALVAAGQVSQASGALLNVAGDLSIVTSHLAGDVVIDNSSASATTIGDTLVGGDFSLVASGKSISQKTGSDIKVAGDFAPNGHTISLAGANNLFGSYSGVSPGVNVVRQAGVITLGDIEEAGDLSVTSLADGARFDSAIHGSAVDLSNATNNIGGAIAVSTTADSITVGADQTTGIYQAEGTSITVAGSASFVAESSSVPGSGVIELVNTGNDFGRLSLAGNRILVGNSNATIIDSAVATHSLLISSAGPLTQNGGAIITPSLLIGTDSGATLDNKSNQIGKLAAIMMGSDLSIASASDLEVGAIAYTLHGQELAIEGVQSSGGKVTLISGGDISQASAIVDAAELSAKAGGSVELTHAENQIDTLGAIEAGQGIRITNAANGLVVSGNVSAADGLVEIVTEGDLALHDGIVVGVVGANDIHLSAARNFINNAAMPDGSALSLGTGRYLIYTTNLADTVKGGLVGDSSLFNSDFASAPPTGIGHGDNMFIYAFTPTLTFTADNLNRQYGFANGALTYTASGFLDGDTAELVFSGNPFLSTTATQGSNVGSYLIDISAGDALASLKGYSFEFVDGLYTIDARQVSIAADAISKIYGEFDPSLSYGFSSGSLYGDDSLVGQLQRASGENAGDYAIGRGTLAIDDGNNGANYDVAFTGADLTIDKARLNVVADTASKTYGQLDPSLTYQMNGLVVNAELGIDDSVLALDGGLTRASGENVGSYAIGKGTIADVSGNYDIAFTGAGLTIDKATLNVVADAASKIYGQLDPTLSYQMDGRVVNAELGIDDSALALDGGLVRASGENVGAYAIGQGTLTDVSGNYDIAYTGSDLTINKATLNVTVDAASKTYGQLDPTLTYVVSGKVVNEALGIDDSALALDGGLARASGENVGSYAIGQGSIADASGNYDIAYAGADLTIDKAALNVAADAKAKTYGDADPSLTYQMSGQVVNAALGIDDSALALDGGLTRASGENVGDYAIGKGLLTDVSGNYDILYAGSHLTIDPRAVTISADSATKVYGNFDPALTFGLSSGSLAFDDAFVGALDRESGENVGSYAFGRNTVGIDDGNGGANYVIDYVGANLDVTPRHIGIAADAASKIYGQFDPTHTYTLTSGNLAFDDTLAGSVSRAAGENAGRYAIGQNTVAVLDGNSGANYVIDFTGADFTIDRATLNVAAESASKTYGQADPSFGFAVSGQVVNAELGIDDRALQVAGSVGREAGENVGRYALTTDGLVSPSNNYKLVISDSDLTIGKATLSVAAHAGRKVYGYIDPALSYSVDGWIVNSDLGIDDSGLSLAGRILRESGENAGVYQIGQNTLADPTGNYVIDYASADFTIDPRAITIAANGARKIYGDEDPTVEYVVADGRLAYQDTITGTIGRESGENVGSYGYTLDTLAIEDGNGGRNYLLSFESARFEINPATLWYVANPAYREFGAPNPAFSGTVLGFKKGETIAEATTGPLRFDAEASIVSPEGSYAIVGSDLSAKYGNYVFRQAEGNETALRITPATLTDDNNGRQLITLVVNGTPVEGGGLKVVTEGPLGTPALVWESKTGQPNLEERIGLQAQLNAPAQAVGDESDETAMRTHGEAQPVIHFSQGRWYTNVRYLPSQIELTLPYAAADVLAGSSSFIQF